MKLPPDRSELMRKVESNTSLSGLPEPMVGTFPCVRGHVLANESRDALRVALVSVRIVEQVHDFRMESIGNGGIVVAEQP